MTNLKLKIAGLVAGLSALASSALAVYTPDAIDTAIVTGVTSVSDRLTNFFTANMVVIFLVVGGIAVLYFAMRFVRRLIGR